MRPNRRPNDKVAPPIRAAQWQPLNPSRMGPSRARVPLAEKEIDRLERQRNQEGGAIADMVVLGLLPGGAAPPFEMKNRIDALSWGPDGVHISYTKDRRLRLDFIEGNYTGTGRK